MIKFTLLIGLGNPGENYENTRHNAGRLFLDFLLEKWGTDWEKRKDLLSLLAKKDIFLAKPDVFLLAKPELFMNQSGEAVRLLSDKLEIKPENICVVHDELDIPLGKWKLSFGRSSYLHKGVLSVEKYLKTKDFWRLRIGIDNRNPEKRVVGERYVLENFPQKEKETLKKVFQEILLDNKITGL